MRPIREVMTITVILPFSVTCRMMVLREPLSHLAHARGRVLDERFEVESVMFTESLSRRCLHFAPRPKSRFTGQASCFVVFPTHLMECWSAFTRLQHLPTTMISLFYMEGPLGVIFRTHLLRVNKFPRNLAMNRLSQAATLSIFSRRLAGPLAVQGQRQSRHLVW